MASLTFGWADYLLFAATLVVALGIGVFFSLTGGRQRSTGEYLMGDRQMRIIPVALSLTASYVSAITVLGHPAEMYLYGTLFALTWFGAALGVIASAFVWVPLIHPLKLTSINEYLYMRYKSSAVKYMGNFFSVLGNLTYTGVCLYGPSTAIEAVTGFPVWASIFLSGAVATIYTTIGGMKAVIWTDVFQAAILLSGVTAVTIQGSLFVGGGSEVWRLAQEGGRIIFDELSADPRVRVTMWGALLGPIIPWISLMGNWQTSVQRFSAIPTLERAKRSVIAMCGGMLVIGPLACFAGIVLFAYYYNKRCDPLTAKYINNPNQLMPHFVMEILNIPGIPGLFIAATYSASLSSASSAINSGAANIWVDVLKQRFPRIQERKAATITKFLCLSMGILSIAVGLLVTVFGGTIVQASISIGQASTTPLVVIFGLGAFFPWANKWGVIISAIFTGFVPLWLNMGAYSIKRHIQYLPLRTDGCNATPITNITAFSGDVTDVMTIAVNTTLAVTSSPSGNSILKELYSISHLWIGPFAAIAGMIVGAVVSLITGKTNPDEVDPALFLRFTLPLWSFLLRREIGKKKLKDMKYEEVSKGENHNNV